MRRRPALLAIAACSAIAAALACGELIADPADAPNVDAGPDSAPADDADADAGGAVADARAFLSPRWATEVTADASMFAGATALSPRGTPMMLGTVNGTLDGVTTSDADPILLEVNADGTLAFAKVLSVKAGGQFGVASTSTSSGVFSAWLDQTDAGSVSHVSRVDPTTATPPTTIGDGGNREFVLGLADFPPGGVFYVGSNSPSKTEPARAIYGVLRANNPPQSVVSPDTSSASSVAARGDGVVVAGFYDLRFEIFGCTLDRDGGTTGAPLRTAFIARIDASAKCTWAIPIHATGASEATIVGASGPYVVAAGTFQGKLLGNDGFGPGVWVARIDDATGDVVWLKTFASDSSSTPRALAVDAQGRSFLAGWLGLSIDFGGGSLERDGSYNAFLASFDADGAHLGSLRFGSGDVRAGGVVLTNDTVYVGGTVYADSGVGLPGSGPPQPRSRIFMSAFSR